MDTLARTHTATLAQTRLHAFLTRYRVAVHVVLLLFAAALARADRHGSAAGAQPATTPVTESSVPADLNDRPIALPDR